MRNLTFSRPALVLLVLVVLQSGQSHAQSPGPDAVAPDSTVRAFHAAMKAGNSSELMKFLAPDVVIMEEGGRESRAEYLDHHLQADIDFSKAVSSHRNQPSIEVNGDVAWVSSTSLMQGTFQNRRVDVTAAELMVLSRTPSGWVIRAIHWSSRKNK